MHARHRIAAAVVCLAFALAPAAAFAVAPQSAFAQNGAGDEQYQDPFSGGSKQPAKKPQPKPQPQQQQTQQQPPTPVQPVPHQQVPSGTQPSSSVQRGAADPGQLPRTGFDVVPLALAGVALVIAGLLLLRRRAAHGRD